MDSKRRVALFFLLTNTFFCWAQDFSETYFASNYPKLGGTIFQSWKTDDYLFLASSKSYLQKETTPCLTAFDKNGKTLWESKWDFQEPENVAFKDLLLASDGFLYSIHRDFGLYFLQK